MSDNDGEYHSLKADSSKIRLVRRSVKGRPKLCPRCLSRLRKIGSFSGWLVPDDYICDKCGYHGHVALEAVRDNNPTDP